VALERLFQSHRCLVAKVNLSAFTCQRDVQHA